MHGIEPWRVPITAGPKVCEQLMFAMEGFDTPPLPLPEQVEAEQPDALDVHLNQLELALEGLHGDERRRAAASAYFDDDDVLRVRRLLLIPPPVHSSS